MKRKSTIFPIVLALLSLGAMSIQVSAQTAIGGITPDQSAMLDVQSTTKGVLFPRLTTAQRDNISPAATGLMIFNTTTECLEINLGTGAASWQSIICNGTISSLNCAGATVTGSLIPGTAASGVSVSVPYTGGNGFAHSGQTVTSTGVTDLTATLAPGTLASGAGSFSYAISGTPSAGGNANFAINIGGQTCMLMIPLCGAYVAAGVWKEFMCHNLGANTDVDPFTPSADLNGNYYQWGRSTIAANAPPSDAIVGSWNGTDANDGSWVDNTKTGSDPCPDGYRVPTIAQWTGVRNFNQQTASGINWTAGASNFSTGRFFGPALFLPATGSRSNSDGALSDRGRFGNYWSSTQVDGTAVSYYLNFWSSGSGSSNDSQRAFGYPVRCIAE